MRWQWQRLRTARPASPPASAFPVGTPDIAQPTAAQDELRITLVGHCTFLIQIGGRNLLTDPMWSRKPSPVQWLGPNRITSPGVEFDQLPSIDAVLLSHDHYDHLDATTIRRITRAHPAARWIAPLRHAKLLRGYGVGAATELDWWDSTEAGGLTVTAAPVQHWSRRVGSAFGSRLWTSYAIRSGAHNVYFTGDSGYCPAFAETGARLGPFDVALLPIGAYEPRWFMRHAHMNPEEAVRAFQDLRARQFVAMHWGTFRLTDEDPLEPPERVRAVWRGERLPEANLHVLGTGETLRL